MAADTHKRLLDRLPDVRGRYKEDAPMYDLTWFRVGGPADVLYTPSDTEDLASFLKAIDKDVPLTIVGVGSNLLVRDGGIEGVVIRMGGGFNFIEPDDQARVRAGASALDVQIAKKSLKSSITGLEFLRGIPGSLGGALRMNAGAYEKELKDVLLEATAVSFDGNIIKLNQQDMGFSYRHSSAPKELVFVEALLQGSFGEPEEIEARMDQITESREATQPIRSRTGGSTFKNPDPEESGGRKAWQLIDEAGCRGLTIGDAQVSEQHCNFLINKGAATAADIEKLGETVRLEVAKKSGINLQWEIRRIGRPLTGEAGF